MFDFDKMLVPVWDTDIVYGESFTMFRDKNGEIYADFLYEPQEVIEVRSASLDTLYEAGKDYFVEGGRLFLTPNTAIPFMEYDEVFMKECISGKCFAYPEGYLLFSEGHFFHDRQIAVTYKCKRGLWQGYVPEYKGDLLHRTVEHLTKDKALKVVLFGDSISVGANASGLSRVAPFQPLFSELFAEKLRREYSASVTLLNPSVGGKDSVWGLSVLDEKVIDEMPDLVIIAFGMNDTCVPEKFAENIGAMVDRVKAANAETDIILVATTTPNPILTDERAKFWNHQHEFGGTLKKFEGDGIAVLDMGALQKELHRRKRFIDTTGNNVNHPNDFFIRIHGQALSALLEKNMG